MQRALISWIVGGTTLVVAGLSLADTASPQPSASESRQGVPTSVSTVPTSVSTVPTSVSTVPTSVSTGVADAVAASPVVDRAPPRVNAETVAAPGAQPDPAKLGRDACFRAFTQRLVEQRAAQQFAVDVAEFERRRAFTEQLLAKRSESASVDRSAKPSGEPFEKVAGAQRDFDAEVERFTRLYEFTQRLLEERDTRDAIEFAHKLALEEKKRTFTLQLVESRQQGASDSNER